MQPIASYKREYNFGNIAQIVAVIGAVGGALWAASGWQSKTDEKVITLASSVGKVNSAVLSNTTAITALINSQAVQDERILQLNANLAEQRQASAAITAQLVAIREDLAAIKQQIKTR